MLEFIFELVLEIILTPIIDGVMYFLSRIIPEEKMPKWLYWTIKIVLGIIVVGAIFAFFIGMIAWFGAEDYTDKIVGKRLFIFSLVTFTICIIIRIFTPNKDDKEDLNDEQ